MSDTVSYTKSNSAETKTYASSSAEQDYDSDVKTDRWSRVIDYRYLICTSCASIMQLWWHPYIHDLKSLVPFLLLYNFFTLIFSYPLLYLELAIGAVTKKSVVKCWDLVPLARGVSITMLITCSVTALCLSVVGAYCLAFLVHSHHLFLPWLHCSVDATGACAARHRPMSTDSHVPPQSFFFTLILDVKGNKLPKSGLGNIVWEIGTYFIITWIFVFLIAMKKIYGFSKLIVLKDVLAYFVLSTCLVGVMMLEGSGKMFRDCDWSVLKNVKLWREAIDYALVEMGIGQGTLIMLGSYCPHEHHGVAATATVAFFVAKMCTLMSSFILGGVHGALMMDYDNVTNIWGGSSASIVLWADFVARVPGNQFWSSLVFFTLYLLSVASVVLCVQTIMSVFKGKSAAKLHKAILMLICVLISLIGALIACTQGGLHILNYLMEWPVSRHRIPVSAFVAFVITYLYGQKTFSEDVYFVTGEYPWILFRVSWAISPIFLMIMFFAGFGWTELSQQSMPGVIIMVVSLLPIIVLAGFYMIFKCRVRNIVT